MTTRLYTSPVFKDHVNPPGHPERPERVDAVEASLSGPDFAALDRHAAPEGDAEAILLAHPRSYADGIYKAVPDTGIHRLDPDTTLSPGSWAAALAGVGGAVAAVDAVFAGQADNAFVASRPPGHHAEKTTAMGFCLFNNAAIAARHAQKAHGAARVAIMDWDVHHGNGTQDIFWDDPSVLYVSTHQMPLYPGTGAATETGAGNIVNVPLPPGTGSAVFRAAFTLRIMSVLEAFRPDFLIVSAGFDAHHRDPLAQMELTEDDFDWATARMLEIAGRHSRHRLVSVLEGGYDLQGLGASAAAHVARLMRG